MQPAAAEIEGDVGRGHDGVPASADAIARLQHEAGERGTLQRVRGAEARGARADDRDIDGGGKARHEPAYHVRDGRSKRRTYKGHPPQRWGIQYSSAGNERNERPRGTECPVFAGHDSRENYATASLDFSARFRSFGSSCFLRRRIDFGVISTSSSSSI